MTDTVSPNPAPSATEWMNRLNRYTLAFCLHPNHGAMRSSIVAPEDGAAKTTPRDHLDAVLAKVLERYGAAVETCAATTTGELPDGMDPDAPPQLDTLRLQNAFSAWAHFGARSAHHTKYSDVIHGTSLSHLSSSHTSLALALFTSDTGTPAVYTELSRILARTVTSTDASTLRVERYTQWLRCRYGLCDHRTHTPTTATTTIFLPTMLQLWRLHGVTNQMLTPEHLDVLITTCRDKLSHGGCGLGAAAVQWSVERLHSTIRDRLVPAMDKLSNGLRVLLCILDRPVVVNPSSSPSGSASSTSSSIDRHVRHPCASRPPRRRRRPTVHALRFQCEPTTTDTKSVDPNSPGAVEHLYPDGAMGMCSGGPHAAGYYRDTVILETGILQGCTDEDLHWLHAHAVRPNSDWTPSPSVGHTHHHPAVVRFATSTDIRAAIRGTLGQWYRHFVHPTWFGLSPLTPTERMIIRDVPPTMASACDLAFYMAPRVNLSRSGEVDLAFATDAPIACTRTDGTFFINAHQIITDTTFDRANIVTLTLHEGLPGHHMQMGNLSNIHDPHLPIFQGLGIAHQTGLVEGWGLYCEQLPKHIWLMCARGVLLDGRCLPEWLQRDDRTVAQAGAECYRAVQQSYMLRAARVTVDIAIHLHGASRGGAIAMLSRLLPDTPRWVLAGQVDRYALLPAQAMCYWVGYVGIWWLRKYAWLAAGRGVVEDDPYAFMASFHRTVLQCGVSTFDALQRMVCATYLCPGTDPEYRSALCEPLSVGAFKRMVGEYHTDQDRVCARIEAAAKQGVVYDTLDGLRVSDHALFLSVLLAVPVDE
jgi:hypothetical protein